MRKGDGPTDRGQEGAVSVSPCETCDIIREADHRIANHLALVSAFIGLRLRELADDPAPPSRDGVRLALESVRTQIEAVARLHRALAGQPRLEAVPVDERLHDICAPLAAVLSGRIEIAEDLASGVGVPALQMLPLTQIVAEAITNAVKHGCPGGRGRIAVSSRQDTEGRLLVTIIDQGLGPPPGFDPADGGLGYRLIGALSRSLGATYEVSAGHPGLRFSLCLPAA